MITLVVFVSLFIAYVLVMFTRGTYREKKEYKSKQDDEVLEE